MCIDPGWEFPRFLNEASEAQWQFVVTILCNLNPQGEVCHSLTLSTCKPIWTVIDSYTSWVNDLSSFRPSVDLNRFPTKQVNAFLYAIHFEILLVINVFQCVFIFACNKIPKFYTCLYEHEQLQQLSMSYVLYKGYLADPAPISKQHNHIQMVWVITSSGPDKLIYCHSDGVRVCVHAKKLDRVDVHLCKRSTRTIIATPLIFALMTDLSPNNHKVNIILYKACLWFNNT